MEWFFPLEVMITDLGMRGIADKFVPQLLMSEQKEFWKTQSY